MSNGMGQKAALRRLLLALFSAAELRRFLRDHHEAIVKALPGEVVPVAELADEAVLVLARHDLVDAHFFAQLTTERPRSAAEIEDCAALWHRTPRGPTASAPDLMLRRFRTAIAAGHKTIHLIGFPHRGQKPATPLQNVCVPLRMCRGESVVPWTLTRLVNLLLTVREHAPRVLVLSAPGSGKTTLCQYLTVVLAGGAQIPGIDAPEVVPLHVSLRDYARRDTSLSILQFVCERAQALQVSISVDVLTQACEDGRAVLIVDGFDEVGDTVARTEHRDRLNAFLDLHPRVPVLVTSRVVGYHDVPLQENAGGAFLELTMAPLSDEEMEDFAGRWYAAIEPDPNAGARGAANLMASIRAAPTVQALATNRLLLTLIALIHRADARLPGERTQLFERCIQMFLDTWPAGRGKRFKSISLMRQRRLLETLAAGLLGRRRGLFDQDLLMARDGLISTLASYWRADDPGVSEPESAVAEWVDYLHEESGLISEVGPSVFQFVHRSLQEYLAACWYKNSVADPVKVIVDHHESEVHREIWLMLVGCLAGDRPRCESLYERMIEHHEDRPETWKFLLGCLAEEASFSRAAVQEILRRTVSLPEVNTAPSAVEQAIGRLWRFSTRHREAVRAWFEHGIRRGPCTDLPALVWAAVTATPVSDVLEWLSSRGDRTRAAASLAPSLWPIDAEHAWDVRPELGALGRWAWSEVDTETAIAMYSTRAMPFTLVCRAAIMTLQAAIGDAMASAVTLQLALDTLAIASAIHASPAWSEIGAIVFEPGGLEVPTAIPPPIAFVSPDMLFCAELPAPRRRWIPPLGSFSPALRDDGEVDLEAITDRFEGIRLFDYLLGRDVPTPEDFWVDARKPYGMDCFEDPDEFGDYGQYDSGNDYPLKEFERDAVRGLAPDFTATSLTVARVQICSPDAHQTPGPYQLLTRLNELRSSSPPRDSDGPFVVDTALVDLALGLHTCHAAHVVIAARSFAGDPALQSSAAVLRQQHVWVLQNWHAIEEGTPLESSPMALALMLTLGWTQCLTTAHWPGTPRWRALLSGPPPSHWWPRVHWYMCWLTAIPNDPIYHAGLAAALADGVKDPTLAGLAHPLLSGRAPS